MFPAAPVVPSTGFGGPLGGRLSRQVSLAREQQRALHGQLEEGEEGEEEDREALQSAGVVVGVQGGLQGESSRHCSDPPAFPVLSSLAPRTPSRGGAGPNSQSITVVTAATAVTAAGMSSLGIQQAGGQTSKHWDWLEAKKGHKAGSSSQPPPRPSQPVSQLQGMPHVTIELAEDPVPQGMRAGMGKEEDAEAPDLTSSIAGGVASAGAAPPSCTSPAAAAAAGWSVDAASAASLGLWQGPGKSRRASTSYVPTGAGVPLGLSPSAHHGASAAGKAVGKAGSKQLAARQPQLIFRGLRVRMGCVCGVTAADVHAAKSSGRVRYGGEALKVATAISSAATGGQILIPQPALDRMLSEGAVRERARGRKSLFNKDSHAESGYESGGASVAGGRGRKSIGSPPSAWAAAFLASPAGAAFGASFAGAAPHLGGAAAGDATAEAALEGGSVRGGASCPASPRAGRAKEKGQKDLLPAGAIVAYAGDHHLDMAEGLPAQASEAAAAQAAAAAAPGTVQGAVAAAGSPKGGSSSGTCPGPNSNSKQQETVGHLSTSPQPKTRRASLFQALRPGLVQEAPQRRPWALYQVVPEVAFARLAYLPPPTSLQTLRAGVHAAPVCNAAFAFVHVVGAQQLLRSNLDRLQVCGGGRRGVRTNSSLSSPGSGLLCSQVEARMR